MNAAELYAFGRSTSQGKWYIDTSRIVGRLYFVNRGCASVQMASEIRELKEGHFYILPRCSGFSPIDAKDFDHTYFDYYSPRILRPDRMASGSLSLLGASHFLRFVNTLLESGSGGTMHETMQALLQGFLCQAEEKLIDDSFIVTETVASAVEHIHAHFATVSTKELSDRAHLCESYFIRLFRESIGLSPSQYIRARRVLHAKRLLSEGVSVEDASEACGYQTPSALYKAVLAETGRSPSALRALSQKEAK